MSESPANVSRFRPDWHPTPTMQLVRSQPTPAQIGKDSDIDRLYDITDRHDDLLDDLPRIIREEVQRQLRKARL